MLHSCFFSLDNDAIHSLTTSHRQDDYHRYIEVFEATSRDVERAKMSMERGGGGGGYGRGGGGGDSY